MLNHYWYFKVIICWIYIFHIKISFFIFLSHIFIWGVFIVKTIKLNKKIIIAIILFFIILFSILFIYSFANESSDEKKDYIKWVDFSISSEALLDTSKLDIDSHVNDSEIKYNWIELLSYLACKNGGNFKNYKKSDLDNLVKKLSEGQSIEELTQDLKLYNYYYESYLATLGGFIGNYSVESLNEDGSKCFVEKYGIKAFLPIAKNYNFLKLLWNFLMRS